MKKLFTLVALLAMFLGANAQGGKWVQVYSIDYSTHSNFPFYVMGYVPEFDNGCLTDYGSDYRYATQKDLDGTGDAKWKDGESSVGTVMAGTTEYQKVTGAGPYWHQYFIADGIQTKIDGKYKVVAKVKASEAVTINVNMGWSWSEDPKKANVSIPESTDFQEVDWTYEGIGGSSCNLVAQPGTSAATIEWQSLVVYEWQKENQRPKEWIEAITFNGDAESSWPAWSLEETDGINANWRGDRTGEICAWALTMGRNFDDQNTAISEDSPRSRPFPADIEEEEGTTNHVFAVHVTQIAAIDDNNDETDDAASIAWSNQFWIQSPQGWKSGTQIKLKFRYKAEHACKVGTQIHKKLPSDYLHYVGIGDVEFTEEWKTFEKTITFTDAQSGGWSVAFNLCSDETNGRTPNVFYFDDFSWQYLKLDQGFFVSGINHNTTKDYDDLDNAIKFEEELNDDDEPTGNLIATVGVAGNEASYVDQIMISTVRGDDQAFKGATLKTEKAIENDPLEWNGYADATNAKLDLPGLGVWKIYIDTEYKAMAFEMLKGTPYEAVDVVTNKTTIVVNGKERDWRGKDNDGNLIEEQEGTGQTYDNQFFIKANRALKAGEQTVIEFKYSATKAARSTTQCHGENPGAYMHWDCIPAVEFTTEEQTYKQEFTVPAQADGMWCIAFDLAVIKEANDYTFKDFKWYLKYDEEDKTMENLINETGDSNFYKKEGAGTSPYIPSGIFDVINDATTRTDVIYNLSGQRVSKDYKGIVIMNGRKVVNK